MLADGAAIPIIKVSGLVELSACPSQDLRDIDVDNNSTFMGYLLF